MFIFFVCVCVCVYLQLITFNDGKVGVNFFGYHAEAGLGGGQSSSNGLLGGLHASAGTPWGQNAAAGLGGSVNGKFFFHRKSIVRVSRGKLYKYHSNLYTFNIERFVMH